MKNGSTYIPKDRRSWKRTQSADLLLDGKLKRREDLVLTAARVLAGNLASNRALMLDFGGNALSGWSSSVTRNTLLFPDSFAPLR